MIQNACGAPNVGGEKMGRRVQRETCMREVDFESDCMVDSGEFLSRVRSYAI